MKAEISVNSFLFVSLFYEVTFKKPFSFSPKQLFCAICRSVIFSVLYFKGVNACEQKNAPAQRQIRLVRSFTFGHQYSCFAANMKDSKRVRIIACNSPYCKVLKTGLLSCDTTSKKQSQTENHLLWGKDHSPSYQPALLQHSSFR